MPFLYRYALVDEVGRRAREEATRCGVADQDIIVATAGVGLIRFHDAATLEGFAAERPPAVDALVRPRVGGRLDGRTAHEGAKK